MAAITGFPSFASEVAAAALRFLFGIASCRSVDFRRRQLDSRKNTARRIITMAPNAGTNGGGNTTPPISTPSSGPVQPTPQISLREVSPPAYPRSISTSGTGSTTSSVTTSTSTETLLPNVFHTRARSECSTVTPTRGLSPGKSNKFAAYPSPPTISSPLPTLHSPSAVFTSTSTHQTILITLPIDNGGSSSSRAGTISASVSSLSSTSFTTTALSSNSPSPSPAPALTPTSSANPRSSSTSTTPVSSPHSSMLKFSTPPSPLKSKSKVKRVQSRKRTPVTTCAISPLRRSPTPYPSFANPSRASASLMKLTPSTPTTPKQKSRSTVKTVVVTPTPKSKHHQQQQFGRGTRKRGSTKGSGPGNTNANAGSVSKTPDTAYDAPGSPKQTHKRAVLLIIDALRFDFVSPDPPEPINPYHHQILTLPSELTKAHPEHSFLFNAYADPPTTTLQRIKALTTGSLPTFVDMGSNFGGSEILEDSIVKQLQLADKSVAFMGDDTWLSVFPTSFHPNLTFPYDSFNVEDLHTVDTGVLTHLFPLLQNAHPGRSIPSVNSGSEKQFDFLIGHFLGVDHVGHRVGPSHPSMHAKLTQMDIALRRVVDLLDDDTLLIVLGDHGMDKTGDHGGDGVLETSSALWIYSKGPPLMDKKRENIHPGLLGYKTFPGAKSSWRSVQQIDLLPTLSLLLGLPIPYNNLGTIIPELFWRSSTKSSNSKPELEYALDLNSRQIRQYLETYRSSSSGSELDSAWNVLQSAWDAVSMSPQLSPQNALEAKLISMASYNRAALSVCRAIWARFNPELMAAGLALMLTAIVTAFFVYVALREKSPQDGHSFIRSLVPNVGKTTAGVGAITFALSYSLRSFLPPSIIQAIPFSSLEVALFTGLMMGCVFAVITSLVRLEEGWSSRLMGQGGIVGVGILLLHGVSFFSNSFTFWEDRLVLWLSATAMVPFVLTGIAAPGLSSMSSSSKSKGKKHVGLFARLGLTTLRGRILGFSFLFLVCIRLMSLVTVCREEQGAYCHVTFYATPSTSSSSSPSTSFDATSNTTSTSSDSITGPSPMNVITTSTTPPMWSILFSLPTAIFLPFVMTRILKITKSDCGIGPAMVWGVIAPALIGSWQIWVLEWVESGGLQASNSSLVLPAFEALIGIVEPLIRLRTLRSWIARGVCALLGLGVIGWSIIPLCLDIHVRAPFASSTSSPSMGANTSTTTQVVVLGYANAYGAPYLLFYLLSFALVYLCTPLPGQVVLGLGAVAFVAYLEALDGVRDAKEIQRVVGNALNPVVAGLSDPSSSSTDSTSKKVPSEKEHKADEVVEPTTFLTIIPLILLTFITFYATGHQSTISSVQWKTGFVLSESVRYPWSVITVVLNSAGPFWLLGIVGGALIGGWKRSPSVSSPNSSDESEENVPKLGLDITHSSILSTLLIQIYFLTLLFGASTSAAVLRRHLMVWKVFAPRFMAAVVELAVLDLGVLIGIRGVGERVVERVRWILGRVGIGRTEKKKEE
ncbi:hypothetical protein AGABI1DRAFT_131414 [Agaricus bisporus var. burnettii JB137-S8]|uniref:GPI ethanolamine phosphate transferase 2 C-terminal domain-containing protein n=1 Tax=Agaricus bisporus var. burnettii (strain JB137-S8 / ATCC MYA-4627 / FGSC 10392) TaxID=597362 RepID=K5WZP6_AGABU|nr:uncharacterized protein AGABI1DRAFT_131414 [Agaricus bisporus var. burnettii JB137-S8]EKM76323.1 hypothetical protein AGABI1DRAFT_131414 [Agaricus bisporus var. burnettii JB137-S8]